MVGKHLKIHKNTNEQGRGVAVCVGLGGRLRQATVFLIFLEFMASRVKIFSNDVDGFSTRERSARKNHSRFMRMFIKSEHGGGDLAAPLWPATSMACKLNERASSFICLGGGGGGIAVSQSCQGCQGLSVCVISWIRRSQRRPKRQSSFVCLSFAMLRTPLCAAVCERTPLPKQEKHNPLCIYICAPMYIFVWYKSSVPMSIFSPTCLLTFSLICSRRCEVCLPMVCRYPFPSFLSVSICSALSGLFCGLLSLIGSVCPLFSHTHTHTDTYVYRDYSFLLLIFIIIWSLFLLIFAYVMQQADCFSDYAEAQLKLIELTFSWMW